MYTDVFFSNFFRQIDLFEEIQLSMKKKAKNE